MADCVPTGCREDREITLIYKLEASIVYHKKELEKKEKAVKLLKETPGMLELMDVLRNF